MERQVEMAIENAKKSMGKGWDMLSPQLQEALIMKEAAILLLSQAHEKYEPSQSYLQAVYAACPEYV